MRASVSNRNENWARSHPDDKQPTQFSTLISRAEYIYEMVYENKCYFVDAAWLVDLVFVFQINHKDIIGFYSG